MKIRDFWTGYEEISAAHITPPEPEIELYETGFEKEIDLLGREDTGNSLSDLVLRIDDPLVIALDGGWGSGKSFFLKCWVGAHLKKHGDTSQTVYFDAFEHDFIDAPLVSLLTRMVARFPQLNAEEQSKVAKVKSAAGMLVPSAMRIAAHLATLGASKHLEDTGDAIAEIIGGEVANSTGNIWKQAKVQHDAMEEFRTALTALTTSKDGPQKLVIVIDELDRCRPNYALSLLEIIKHFFAVPNVHFVLGVNMKQLENSVHARYGAGIDAGLYLQKFVGLTMRLPDTTPDYHSKRLPAEFFSKISHATGLEKEKRVTCWQILQEIAPQEHLSLRGVQQVLSVLTITTAPRDQGFTDEKRDHALVVSLAIMKVVAPDHYKAALSGTLEMRELQFLIRTHLETFTLPAANP